MRSASRVLAFVGPLAALFAFSSCGKSASTTSQNDQAADPSNGPVFDGDPSAEELIIDPPTVTLDATGAGVTQAFTAKLRKAKTAVDAKWETDLADIGSVDSSGLFTTAGVRGGTARVFAQSGDLHAVATVTVQLKLSSIPASVDPAVLTAARAGGAADAAFKWLYPYDGTVFARGLLSPSLQFAGAGAGADAFYVTATSKHLNYEGYFAATSVSPSRLTLPQATWDTWTRSAGSGDPLDVRVTKISGGKITGPAKTTWNVAAASLKGVVYYNSYDSLRARNGDAAAPGVGAILRIKPGAQAEVYIGGASQKGGSPTKCTVCHTVNSQGTLINAANEGFPSALFGAGGDTAKLKRAQADGALNFAGPTPDGSLLMLNATVTSLANSWIPNVPGVTGARPSRLVDTATGATIAAKGWTVDDAQMPSFSADGTKMTFVRGAVGGPTWKGAQALWLADFDAQARAFSDVRQVASSTTQYLGWPAVTPDGKYVIYEANSRPDHMTWNNDSIEARSELYVTHLATKTTARLDVLNGIGAAGQVTLPYGEPESRRNFMPTILPQPVGGYLWVVFTSRRNYGNTAFYGQAGPPSKKIWVAAIDLDPSGAVRDKAVDLSHPAFYLEGQELEAGNSHAYVSLDACVVQGNECREGVDDCCGGFCRAQSSGGTTKHVCVPERGLCSEEGEACTTASDCCDANDGAQCLNGRCVKSAPR